MSSNREHIPGTATLVRYLRKSEIIERNGVLIPATEAFADRELSVDWLELTTVEDGYRRLPKSAGHATLPAQPLTDIGEKVVHDPKPDPDPEKDNPGHSLVIYTGEEKSRPKQQRLFFIRFLTSIHWRSTAV